MAKLRRALDIFGVTGYGIGVIIGAGIYVLIGVAAGLTGDGLWLSFLLAASIAVLSGLSYAELASMFPRSAAEYIYIKKAYKNNFFAFILGWLIIFVGIVSAATVSKGFSNYFLGAIGMSSDWMLYVVSAGAIGLMAFINYLGIRESSRINLAMVSITIVGLLLIIGLGLPKIGQVDLLSFPSGFSGVFAAAAIIFFAYLGFEEIVNVAEETKRPRKIIPKALMIAIGISTLLYVLTSISAVGLLSSEQLGQSATPLADAVGTSFLGGNGAYLISVIAIFTIGSTLLGMLLVTSRMIYGMSAERALPKLLSRINKKTSTPYIAIAVVASLSIIFLFYGSLEKIASVTSVGSLIIFTNINVALIWLRISKPSFKRPFKVPFSIRNIPVLSVIGAGMSVFMIFQFDYDVAAFGILIASIGAMFYILRKQKIIPV